MPSIVCLFDVVVVFASKCLLIHFRVRVVVGCCSVTVTSALFSIVSTQCSIRTLTRVYNNNEKKCIHAQQAAWIAYCYNNSIVCAQGLLYALDDSKEYVCCITTISTAWWIAIKEIFGFRKWTKNTTLRNADGHLYIQHNSRLIIRCAFDSALSGSTKPHTLCVQIIARLFR